MDITPITDKIPACFGVCCERHAQCARYQAVEGAALSSAHIGYCEPDERGERPLFVPIKENKS